MPYRTSFWRENCCFAKPLYALNSKIQVSESFRFSANRFTPFGKAKVRLWIFRLFSERRIR